MKNKIAIFAYILFLSICVNKINADEIKGKIIDIIVRLPDTYWETTSIFINTVNDNTDNADVIMNINTATYIPAYQNIARSFKTNDEILFDDEGIFFSDVFNMHEVSFKNVIAKNNISILNYFPEYEFEFPFAAARDKVR